MNKKLKPLLDELTEIAHIGGAISVLYWDLETYMPKGSAEARSEQIAYLSGLSHKKFTSEKFKNLLGEFVDLQSGKVSDDFTQTETRMLDELYKDWKKSTCKPQKFVEEFSKLTSQAQPIWADARQKDDYSIFSPILEKIIKMSQKEAEFLGYETVPYDALMDQYEPGLKTDEVNLLFGDLRDGTIALLNKIKNSSAADYQHLVKQKFDKQKQWDLGIDILKAMGYDFNTGRQDYAAHPFTTEFHPTDVRITTRIFEDSFLEGLGSTIHEGGHALYEQGLDATWYPTPICESISLGIHESQSRLWENIIANSKAFWSHWLPKTKAIFPQLKNAKLDEFYKAANTVKPSLIRVEADEVTYNLHIMIRFEIEQMIINEQFPVADLPELWNDKYEEYLGIRPDSNANGVLQDVHWAHGSFGYFPTYAMGNLYSIYWVNQAETEIADFWGKIANGEMLEFREWLREKIHKIGRSRSASELLSDVTGKTLSAQPYLDYLNRKYGEIYGV